MIVASETATHLTVTRSDGSVLYAIGMPRPPWHATEIRRPAPTVLIESGHMVVSGMSMLRVRQPVMVMARASGTVTRSWRACEWFRLSWEREVDGEWESNHLGGRDSEREAVTTRGDGSTTTATTQRRSAKRGPVSGFIEATERTLADGESVTRGRPGRACATCVMTGM